jgi:hypothetical protein
VVRRGLRPWLWAGAFALLVGVLTFIALDRIEESPSLEGRWELVLVETPEGSFHPEKGPEWIEFDGTYFTGHMNCVDFEGDFTVSGANGFMLGGWGSSGGCVEMEGTGYAFENYFHLVSEIKVGMDLVLESSDATVQFVFTREAA